MISPLEEFGQASRSRAEAAMLETPLVQLEQLIETLPPVRSLAARLGSEAGRPPRVIAEMKKASPSAGLLREQYLPRQIALGYTRVGAVALSVLTEPDRFGGDVAHLAQVRAAHLPVLRKDFLVTPYQVAQSRVAGADAVLLIAALLAGPALGIMILAARRYGLESLVEVHDEEELSRAIDLGAGLIGVNNRDLRTLDVDLGTSERLAPRIPKGGVTVAESGIRARRDIDRLMRSGYENFLIGEALMREKDPGDALWKLMQPIE